MQFQVIRPDKSKHPFMRGMLAHKLMQRGLSFDQAYQISKDARSYFQQQSEVTTESLMQSVDELIVDRYGQEVLKKLNSELFPSGKQISVYRRNATVPFSKGLLTQSITSAGVKPEEAYQIAFFMETNLMKKGIFRISKKKLFEEVYRTILKKYSPKIAQLYKLASRIDELDKPLIIYIGGASGTGKSVMATFLAGRLGINKITGTDTIREIMRLVFKRDLLPSLHNSSIKAGIGMPKTLDKSNRLIGGFCLQAQQVSVGVKAVVDRAVKEKTSMIIEGIHLLPYMQQILKEGTKRAYHIPITLSLMNEKHHKNRFFEREKSNELRKIDPYLSSFENIRIIHEFCASESEHYEIEVVDNEDFDETTNTLTQLIINTLQEQVNSTLLPKS
uniref:2-phosphoglycerate kinase n=1 Tax=uncultured delta proteobacterium HF0200_19J16 TaxID=710831 RepID=E0XUA5_9DELT|nr:2-phosphoglycerate kinase [uncultured delta proteobacterium HF0200_19J16]